MAYNLIISCVRYCAGCSAQLLVQAGEAGMSMHDLSDASIEGHHEEPGAAPGHCYTLGASLTSPPRGTQATHTL